MIGRADRYSDGRVWATPSSNAAPKGHTAGSSPSPTSSSKSAAEPDSPNTATGFARSRSEEPTLSALEDQFQRARAVIHSLVLGVHPTSGKDLPKNTIINEVEVTRALGTAVLAIDQVNARLARRARIPESVGQPWTEEEERRLHVAFIRGEPVPEIATEHGRTIRAIRTRLEKLGLLTRALGTASAPYKTTPNPKEKK
jgi:hypothetical protein